KFKSYPANQGAAFLIVEKAVAAHLAVPVEAEMQYRRSQVAIAVCKVLRSDKSILFGRVLRHRISWQGKHPKNHVYEMMWPVIRPWLTETRKAQILSQKWLCRSLVTFPPSL